MIIGAEHSTHSAYSIAVREQMSHGGLVEGGDVLLLGEREDIERQLAGMDVMALAAVPRSEGITTAILEGMAAGLPVVVNDVGALREAVVDNRTGFVVQPGDVDGFADALVRLLGDSGLRFRMGREARVVAEERFGVAECAETHVRAYTRALNSQTNARTM